MKTLLPTIVLTALVSVIPAAKAGEAQLQERIENLEEQVAKLTEEIERLRAINFPGVAKRPVNEIIIDVAANGQARVVGKVIGEQDLLRKLRAIQEIHEDQAVRIRGEASTKFEDVVRVIEICQKAKIWNISFATTRNRPNKSE